MDSLQPSVYKYNLFVLGDPIVDEFIVGHLDKKHTPPRFNPSGDPAKQAVVRDGGVLNVLRNLHHFLMDTDILIREFSTDNKPVVLTRYIDEVSGETYIETFDRHVNTEVFKPPLLGWLYWLSKTPKALVLSDYNKGSCTGPLDETLRDFLDLMTPFEFIVADTRYGTLNTDWLDYSKLNILHATGNEINNDIKKEFDYILHTNGPHQVVIYYKSAVSGGLEPVFEPIASLPVPDTEIVDTIGAGDTFTAAVAAYLSFHRERMSEALIIEACRFAIKCCQEVIVQKYTAIPETKLTKE